MSCLSHKFPVSIIKCRCLVVKVIVGIYTKEDRLIISIVKMRVLAFSVGRKRTAA